MEQKEEQNSQEPGIIAEKSQTKFNNNQKNGEKMQEGKPQKESPNKGENKNNRPYNINIEIDNDQEDDQTITFDCEEY